MYDVCCMFVQIEGARDGATKVVARMRLLVHFAWLGIATMRWSEWAISPGGVLFSDRHADERNVLSALERSQRWTPQQRDYLNQIKRCVAGRINMTYMDRQHDKLKLYGLKDGSPCAWDCERRATMIEPLAADLKRRGVAGDFIEAGVYRGGLSIAMAAILSAQNELVHARDQTYLRGERIEYEGTRRMWLADTFDGMPDPDSYTHRFVEERREAHASGNNISVRAIQRLRSSGRTSPLNFPKGLFRGSVEAVTKNFARCFTPYGTWKALGLPSGVHLLQGLFADTLKDGAKGPFALIRSDSDIYSSVYETLHHLYPRLSRKESGMCVGCRRIHFG